MKRTIALLLALVIVVGIISYVPVTAQAAEVNSGKCGENLTWTLDGDGVLTISGSGDMYDFDYNSVPWQNHKSNIYEVDIEEGVTSIGAYAFYDCFSLCNLKIANTVVRIGKSAFDCCTGLSSVVIPNSVVTIGDYAFRMCERMEEAVIGSGVKCIGDGAFAYCWNLSKITFRGDAPGFIYYAFSGVTATAYYPVGNRTWTSSAMMSDANITWVPYATENIAAYGTCGDNLTWTLDEDGLLTISGSGAMDDYNTNAPWCDYRDAITKVIICDGVTSIGGRAFYQCEKMVNIEIPNSVTAIGESAFYFCYALETINLPDGLTSIAYNTFSDCASLTEIVIPDGVTEIGLNAFYRCYELESVILPDSLLSFDGAPFYACKKLTEITIPANVTTLGFRMFPYCNSLTKITFMGDAPFIESDTFDGVTATVYYPAGNATWTVDVMQNYGGTITWTSYGNPGPVITQQPTNAEAALGENYCVTVEAEGEGLKYQWYFRNAGSDKWYKSSVRDNTYDDVMTKARAGREVYCVITDANGNKVTTDTVKLIRVAKEELQIVTQPVSDEAALGDTYSVTVVAKGEDLKYQWYFRNEGSNIWYRSSVRTDTYTNVMTKARAGREIYCVITDALGNTVTTDVVKLVRVLKEDLQIVTQPNNATAALGDNYCVTVEAKGEGLKYQWYFRNAGSDKWYKSSVRDNTYDDVMTKARAGREVYCVITDALGNTVTTEIARLIRVPKEELKLTTPVADTYAAMGQKYCITVNAQGEGLKYTWYFRNAGSDTWYRSGVTDNTYDDVMTKARANREVYCVITDALGNTVTTDVVKLVYVENVTQIQAEEMIAAADVLLAQIKSDPELYSTYAEEYRQLMTYRDETYVNVHALFVEPDEDGVTTQEYLDKSYAYAMQYYTKLSTLVGDKQTGVTYLTVADAIAANVDDKVTVKGIVGPSLVNKTGFYLIDETGVIAVETTAAVLETLKIGYEVVLEADRAVNSNGGSGYCGQTCLKNATVVINNYGSHAYSTESFKGDISVADFYNLDITKDYTTSVFTMKATVVVEETPYYTNIFLSDGTTKVRLYSSSANQYSWLKVFAGQEVTVEIAACNWNSRTYYMGCVLAVINPDGSKTLNTLNFN